LGNFRQLWAALGSFGQLWAALGSFGQLWAALGNFGQLWATLGNFGQLWEGFGSFSFGYLGHLGSLGYLGHLEFFLLAKGTTFAILGLFEWTHFGYFGHFWIDHLSKMCCSIVAILTATQLSKL
jgi:hypothetical protein